MNTRTAQTKDRILSVASRLFYQHGIRAVGIDRVIAEAGIAKMTLYQHFKTKDDLILAFLESWGATWRDEFMKQMAQCHTPEEKLLICFDLLVQRAESSEFRGCAFINTALEVADPDHAIHGYVASTKRALRDLWEKIAQKAAIPAARELADQLLIIFEGALVSAWIQQNPETMRHARRLAELCIEQAKRRE
ncbi:MAG TPA: TetR/AcrR family transcriptional regulator [Oculatellaceae cyanobacterium]|jgi:AcrR family transcriptional regulator